MSNKEKYEGKTVQIYAPFGTPIRIIQVSEVLKNDVLVGTDIITDVVTSYYLGDGITAKVIA